MSEKMLITGVTQNKGDYEGVKYDYCTIQGLARLKGSLEGTAKGSGGIEYKCPADMWNQLKDLVVTDASGKPGIYYMVELETVAGRRGAKEQICVSVKALPASEGGSLAAK
jgi:hypothetical protein